MRDMSQKLSILISSFDGYSVCWEPLCHGFQKYWSDCPFPLHIITNHLDVPCGQAIKTGDDVGWSRRLRIALDRIDTPYVIYGQEDYWIKKPVNTQNVLDYVGVMDSGYADYIRLINAPGPDIPFLPDERLGIIANEAEYRTSTQFSMWRKSVLLELLSESDTPWGFEVEGPRRSAHFGERFLCVTKRQYGIDYVMTAVIRGMWTKMAREYAKQEDISIEWENLPPKPLWFRIKYYVQSRLHRVRRTLQKSRIAFIQTRGSP